MALAVTDNRLAIRMRARNTTPLRIVALLIAIFVPLFWVLDFFVLPVHVITTLYMRSAVALFAVLTLWASYRRSRWFKNNTTWLTFVLPLSTIWSIAVMCWLHLGYESPYYAGMNLVVLVIGIVFSWSIRQEILFYSLAYFFYMAPLVLGVIKITDLSVMLSNQFFFVSTIILTAISQRHRVLMEQREFQHHRSRQQYLTQLRKLATTDTLTGLYNRAHILSHGEREFRRCDRHGRNFSVVMVDIDWFKRINDTYTHRVGDKVIQGVAKRLLTNVRAIDIVGRFGGEEFLILLPETELSQAAKLVAGRIQLSMRTQPIETSQGPLPVSLSIGVAGAHKGEKLSSVIHRADEALYQAKGGGRDRVVEASPPRTHLRKAG